MLDVVTPRHQAALVDDLLSRPGQDGLEVDDVLVDIDGARLRVAQAGRVGPLAYTVGPGSVFAADMIDQGAPTKQAARRWLTGRGPGAYLSIPVLVVSALCDQLLGSQVPVQ